MAVRHHRDYTLISRPRFDTHVGVWRPYASAVRNEPGTFVYHRFSDLEQTFPTEEEAEGFGFAVARGWVDKER